MNVGMLESPEATGIRLSEVISALSYALDVTEGQREGHAVRSCLIGMRLAQELGLSEQQRAPLFYSLLLKDLGCSSNAAKMCILFQADDREIKRRIKLVNWTNKLPTIRFTWRHALPGGTMCQRFRHLLGMTRDADNTSQILVKVRCERGADIARMLGFPEATAEAILSLDERWDGKGHPLGLQGEESPLEGRICSLAQTMEVFCSEHGLDAACQVAERRSRSWFDPQLVEAFLAAAKNGEFRELLRDDQPRARLADYEPTDQMFDVDDAALDRISEAFSRVIDAKSPWTVRHSEGVADIAVGIAQTIGLPVDEVRELRRAALLHDIGKLGVSNLILDKPGQLTADEFAQMREHTVHTQRILERVACFRRFADYASAHHERLDGRGYHRGLQGDELTLEARILAVADVCEALTADRPYRPGMSAEQVIAIFNNDRGTAFCPRVVDAFLQFQDRVGLFERLGGRQLP